MAALRGGGVGMDAHGLMEGSFIKGVSKNKKPYRFSSYPVTLDSCFWSVSRFPKTRSMDTFNPIQYYTATDTAFDGRFVDPGYNPPQEENITTINAKIDRSLFTPIMEVQMTQSLTGTAADKKAIEAGLKLETAPPFALWASAEPGQIAVQCTTELMPHLVEERAAVVITNASRLMSQQDTDFQFAGIVRTRFAAPKDNGAIGPEGDEYFTLTIGGKVQLLNNSNSQLRAGDCVAWTFGNQNDTGAVVKRKRGAGDGPRQIQLKKCVFTDPYKFGKVTSTIAKSGGFVDILIQATTL